MRDGIIWAIMWEPFQPLPAISSHFRFFSYPKKKCPIKFFTDCAKKNFLHQLIFGRDTKTKLTFLMFPCPVPKNATVCLSVVARVTAVREVLLKCKEACVLIGVTPEILRPTSQKFKMFPVLWKNNKPFRY